MSREVLIIDHGLCNLDSVRRALEECGAVVLMSDEPAAVARATKILLPGVGAFGDAMRILSEKGLVNAIRKAALEDKIPFFGMCLGMQLMASQGSETMECEGLGLIPGRVVKLEPKEGDTRIPHMGWNEVYQVGDPNPVFNAIDNGKDFYFAHSFHVLPENRSHIAATTPYCGGFISSLRKEHIFGVQFHPEKSQRVGMQMLKNFVEY